MSTSVFVSIGNSDDALTQLRWSQYVVEVDNALRKGLADDELHIHGFWLSESSSQYQNAGWALELKNAIDHPITGELMDRLSAIRREFNQTSLVWAVADTEFI